MPDGTPSQSILVVEDESLLRWMAVEMFEEAGFDVVEAPTAEEALRVLESGEEIAGLFTDVETASALDGLALARITHQRFPETVIVVVSGRAFPNDRDLPPGAVFVTKPYDVKAVIATLNHMLAEAASGSR